MSWRKLGHIYTPSGARDWAVSHAANPIPEHLGGDRFRIYFSTRDAENRSSVGWVEIDLKQPQVILAEAEAPVLAPGELGMFDDSGVSIGCIVPVGQKRHLYYMGWKLTVRVPWQNALGLAISEGPDAPFQRVSRFPILPLSEEDPYTISYPWVTREEGVYRMWYGSNIAWGREKADMRHVLKYASSEDGVSWRRDGRVIVDFADASEYAICKPCVVRDVDAYRMWFCARGPTYRIFEAASPDGLRWTRAPGQAPIDVSTEGWDSEMIEYPCVFDHDGQRYLLYCGNGFAATGFGLARWEAP
jgi:predicted GH43/DUF377 family glycosyl hydrolase